MDLTTQVNHKEKIKESKKANTWILPECLKTVEREVSVIPVVIGILGTIHKGLEKRLRELDIKGIIDDLHTTVPLKSARILRRVLETCGKSISLRHQRKNIS